MGWNSPCLTELLQEMKEVVIRQTFSVSQMQLNLLGTGVLALKLFVYIQILACPKSSGEVSSPESFALLL